MSYVFYMGIPPYKFVRFFSPIVYGRDTSLEKYNSFGNALNYRYIHVTLSLLGLSRIQWQQYAYVDMYMCMYNIHIQYIYTIIW